MFSRKPKSSCGVLFQEMYVPSLGARVAAKRYSWGLFGEFEKTTRGFPGIHLLMKADITRPWESVPPPGFEFATNLIVLPAKYAAASNSGAAAVAVGGAVVAVG